jgi:hypothetical protein
MDRNSFPSSLLLLNTNPSLLNTIFQQKTSKNGKWVKRWRNFSNNIPLESSNRGESIESIYFEDGALYNTRIRGEGIRV